MYLNEHTGLAALFAAAVQGASLAAVVLLVVLTVVWAVGLA